MIGEKHMAFTWAFELVSSGLMKEIVVALQKSVTEKNCILVVKKGELKDTFGRLHGFSRDAMKHFDESVRFLRKSGIIYIDKGAKTYGLIRPKKNQEFLVDKEIENVDATSDRKIYQFIARKTYGFHIPFRLLIDIINRQSEPVHREVFRELLSKEMLKYAKDKKPNYYQKKKNEMKKRSKPVSRWKYPLPHFNVFLTLAEKVNQINREGIYVERVRVAKERKISYDQFKQAILEEYDRVLKRHPKILMASIDELKSSVCRKLDINEDTFQKKMLTLILRNMGKITIYRQRAKEREKGLRMPDNLIIYAILIKNGVLT